MPSFILHMPTTIKYGISSRCPCSILINIFSYVKKRRHSAASGIYCLRLLSFVGRKGFRRITMIAIISKGNSLPQVRDRVRTYATSPNPHPTNSWRIPSHQIRYQLYRRDYYLCTIDTTYSWHRTTLRSSIVSDTVDALGLHQCRE